MTSIAFKLFHLPYLAYEHAVKLMVIEDIYCLSCCSKKVTDILKHMKIQMDAVIINWQTHPTIEIERTFTEYCFVETYKGSDPKLMESLESQYRHDGFGFLAYITMNDFEDCARLSNHVRSIFKIQKFEIVFYSEDQDNEKMKKYLSLALDEQYDRLTILGIKTASLEFFNYLMNTVNLKGGLRMNCVIPEHFRHENAMKFKSVEYSNACWITLDDLKSIRNLDSVILENTTFNSEDLKNFLHFWISCEYDMMGSLTVTLTRGNALDRESILKGTVNFKVKRPKFDAYYILSKEHPQKKYKYGRIIFEGLRSMHLEAYEPDEYSADTISYLKLLEKKKSLKIKKIELEKKETSLLKNWKEFTVGDYDLKIKAIRPRKEEIDFELETIQKSLEQLGFVENK